jgi:hypothetical protein
MYDIFLASTYSVLKHPRPKQMIFHALYRFGVFLDETCYAMTDVGVFPLIPPGVFMLLYVKDVEAVLLIFHLAHPHPKRV